MAVRGICCWAHARLVLAGAAPRPCTPIRRSAPARHWHCQVPMDSILEVTVYDFDRWSANEVEGTLEIDITEEVAKVSGGPVHASPMPPLPLPNATDGGQRTDPPPAPAAGQARRCDQDVGAGGRAVRLAQLARCAGREALQPACRRRLESACQQAPHTVFVGTKPLVTTRPRLQASGQSPPLPCGFSGSPTKKSSREQRSVTATASRLPMPAFSGACCRARPKPTVVLPKLSTCVPVNHRYCSQAGSPSTFPS